VSGPPARSWSAARGPSLVLRRHLHVDHGHVPLCARALRRRSTASPTRRPRRAAPRTGSATRPRGAGRRPRRSPRRRTPRFPPRASRACRASRSSWRPRSPMPAPTTRSASWRTGRRRCAVSRRSSRSRRHAGRCSRGSLRIGRLLSVEFVEMVRYEGDRVAVVMAGWGTLTQVVSIRTRVPLEGRNLTRGRLPHRTCRPPRRLRRADRRARDGRRHSLGHRHADRRRGPCEGALIAASTHDERVPAETESRMGQFTELMATAIANAEARAEVAPSCRTQSGCSAR
jgi:hypothetical protein